jgi:PAS domain-containing protein
MYWYSTVLSLLLLFAAATSTIITFYAWKRRPVPGSAVFAVTMLAVAQWALAFLAQMVSPDLADKVVWATIQYLGLLILPVTWLVFTLQFTGQGHHLNPPNLLILSFVPIVSFLLILTNDAHHLFWHNHTLQIVNDLPVLVMMPAFWYWVNAAFLYACYLVGSLLLLTSQRYEISSLVPHQALILATGLLLPWFGLALQLAGLNTLSLMPLAFALSGIVVARYALCFRFSGRSPLADQGIVSSLGNGILAIDRELTVVDANTAAAAILQRPLTALLGLPLANVWPELAAQYPSVAEQPLDVAYTRNGDVHF